MPTFRAQNYVLITVAWSVIVVVGVLLALVCFGGSRVAWEGNIAGAQETWEHGWPLVFLQRNVNWESNRFQFWNCWKYNFQAWCLAVDLLVFAVVMGLLLFGPRLIAPHQSATRHQLTFSLSTGLVVLTVVCVVLGSIAHPLAVSRSERAIDSKLWEHGHFVGYRYIGPVWFGRLMGDQLDLNYFQGVGRVYLRSVDKRELDRVSELTRSLRCLEEFRCYVPKLTDVELNRLLEPNCRTQLRVIELGDAAINGSSFADPRTWPKLVEIEVANSNLDDAGFENLSKIRTIERIDASGTKITKKSIALAATMPNLKVFKVKNTDFTEANCAALEARGVDVRRN